LTILINHLGYKKNGLKKAIVKAPRNCSINDVFLIDKISRKKIHKCQISEEGSVNKWKDWYFWRIDFSDFKECGSYKLTGKINNNNYFSETFQIGEDIFRLNILSNLLFYLKSQRCSGEYDKKDISISFFGDRKDEVDVHGGWYDASGDYSKYLSHLSFANYMNPQQTPLITWGLVFIYDYLKKRKYKLAEFLKDRFFEEILNGADFLMRMQDSSGYFYMTVFDQWTHDPEKRCICAYSTQKGNKSEDYQAGYRQGGGMAIAALARTSVLGIVSDFSSSRYLDAAIKGFDHLEKNNLKYLDNGKENIIDDYCALLAATEIYAATKNEYFLAKAKKRALLLINKISHNRKYSGWWRVEDNNERPYFHAAESGLPVISLLRFLEVCPLVSCKEKILETVKSSLEFELNISDEVNNPFGYARQYVKGLNQEAKTAFFIPHNNESGYWWQGENARIASLAVAARYACNFLSNDRLFTNRLTNYAINQIDWILGLNPFDACMLYHFGTNNVNYEEAFYNAPGGIINGITSGFNNEDDIDFLPEPQCNDSYHRWRWAEQWITNTAWFLIAICLEDIKK